MAEEENSTRCIDEKLFFAEEFSALVEKRLEDGS